MTKKTCRIDECARRVLVAAQWPTHINISSTNDDGVKRKSNIRRVVITPYLDELERSLDLLPHQHTHHCPPPHQAQSRGDDSANCRAADGSTQSSSSSWSPQILDDADEDDDDDDAGPSLLIELAPFTSEFYVALTALVNEAYRPTTTTAVTATATATATYEIVNNSKDCNDDDDDGNLYSSSAAVTTTSNDRQQILHEALYSVEMYSLPYMHDATRITNILLALQHSNIATASTSSSFSMGDDDDDDVDNYDGDGDGMNSLSSSFLSLLLQSSTTDDGDKSNNSILSSLFHHWSQLSRMEGELRNLVKRYTNILPVDSESCYAHYCNYRQGCEMVGSAGVGSSSDGAGGDSDANAKSSSSSSSRTTTTTSSFLSERALSIETLRSRFENELVTHITSLHDLLSYLYLHANVSMRGKCRRWMGGWLRNFAYGGSGANVSLGMTAGGIDDTDNVLGSSFVHFCPLLFATTTITHKGTGKKVGVVGIGQSSNALGGVENTSACGVESLLQVLQRIILGFRRPLHINDDDKQQFQLRTSHKHLLFDVILPLHRPSGMVLWRDQTPIIGLYHETLTKIMAAFITKFDRSLVGPVIGALLHPDIWPVGEGGNTPKVVLLLHEVDTLLGLLRSGPTTLDNDGNNNNNNNKHLDTEHYISSFDTYLIPLITRLCFCISSENSRTSERALQFFRNSTFVHLVKRRLGDVGSILLRALCRCPSMDIPWNPTVRKMTLLVLQELEGYYIGVEDAHMTFEKGCDDALLGVNLSSHDNNHGGSSVTVVRSSKVSGTAHVDTHSRSSPNISGNLTSIRGAMGSWKPPPSKKTSSIGPSYVQPPPLTVTGVAPWAVGSHINGGQKQPPLAITGVAPWAVMKQLTQNSIPRPPRRSTGQSTSDQLPSMEENSETEVMPENEHESQNKNMSMTVMRTYLDEVRLYMAKLKPNDNDDSEESTDGVSKWAKAQMNESPVLLHNLKFHDLVFGQELGTGAFGTVKYARHIDKTKTRSSWPEYAVKVVSTQKIEEMGYEQSINMEIAILGTLSHPGISRLVSSFRFRDGAYLVLEYASGGDLHTLLRRNGSLDHDSTRFVIGSVAAALSSIHERGFVYVDCKPENVLITETGHIKITDFGGCRPVTQEAKDMVKESSKNLLKQLRDGDWRPNNHDKLSSSYSADRVTAENDQEEEDQRIEGTTAYFSPEVVIGGYPTTAADVWALGCVLFQCISGQPPILEDTDELTVQKIVTFNVSTDDDDDFFGKGGSTFRDDAKALIRSMLSRDAPHRPNVNQIAEFEFFEGMDIFTLHKNPAHPLDVGSVAAPASDAKWARRQFSSIWAPQPHNYNIHAGLATKATVGTFCTEVITEGNEADEEFLVGLNIPKLLLTKIRE